MKLSIKSIATLAIGLVFSGTQLFASTTSGEFKVLSDQDWAQIQEQAELEAMLDIDEMPSYKVMNMALDVDLKPGTFTTMELDAPFNDNEEIGLVVMDSNGEVLYRDEGLFKDKKSLRFRDYIDYDMTYVIKLYSDEEVYETKVQVVYR